MSLAPLTPDEQARFEEAILSYLHAVDAGQAPSPSEFVARYPGLETELLAFLADQRQLAPLVTPLRLSAEVPSLLPGQRLGDYELLEELGRGGMGVVYKARQQSLNRVVALKVILAGGHAGADDLARFRAEAEVVARLQHPNVIQIHEIGEHDSRPFFSLELCPGGSLEKRLQGTPLAAPLAAAVAETLARGIQAAHEAGVIHRDLKPANILLTAGEWPTATDDRAARGAALATLKITDFGLAKRLDGVEGLTRTGVIMGTASYMAPEQARGQSKAVGPAADVYALGAVLYELLTGRPPFKAATPLDTILQLLSEEPVPPSRLQSKVPRDLETICLKCLEKQPGRRYASAADLADELRRFLDGVPIRARPAGPPERAWRWVRRNPLLATLIGTFCLFLAVAIAGLIWHQRQEARALVEALPDAATSTVPARLRELEDYRFYGRPLLRELWENATLTEPQRVRVGLALADDPEVRARLVQMAPRTDDPAEVLLIRDALMPYAQEVRAGLWERLDDEKAPVEARVRILILLAALDAEGPAWERHAGLAVDKLTSVDWWHLPTWKAALEPKRDTLLPLLRKAFADSTRRLNQLTDSAVAQTNANDEEAAATLAAESERRQVLGLLVAEYAGYRLEDLLEVLLEGDGRQFTALSPKVQAQRERAVALLEGELDRSLAPDWQDVPLDPAWGPLDAALVAQIEGAGGMVTERFALCQTLPLEAFDAVAEGLRRSGYRLMQLRPYQSRRSRVAGPGRPLTAAVWRRDGREAVWAHGLEAMAARERDAALRARGLLPLDMAGYLVPAGGKAVSRYAVVWGPKDVASDDGQLHVALSSEEFHATDDRLLKERYSMRTQVTVLTARGWECSGVWWKPTRKLRTDIYNVFWPAADYENEITLSNLQTDLHFDWDPEHVEQARDVGAWMTSVAPSAGLGGVPWWALVHGREIGDAVPAGVGFGAAWIDSATYVSEESHGLSPTAHLRRCRELAARGYRPAALTVLAVPVPGEPAGEAGLVTGSVWNLPVVPESGKDDLARRQARAAVALVQLGAPERVWPLLEHSEDPRRRTFLVHAFGRLGTDVRALLARLDEEREPSRRRALVLSLGAYPFDRLEPAVREPWRARLRQWYREEPDAGLHAAVDWLLRKWGDGAEVARIDKDLRGAAPRQWYVNGQGQTLVVIPGPTEFWMGSPGHEKGRVSSTESLRQVLIPRSFAIGAKEVAIEQYARFHPDDMPVAGPASAGEEPVTHITWYEAAAYCNWLSEREGISPDQWCFLPNREGKYASGMRLAPGYLTKTGYRLPTSAEWEYACRAGATTRRFYGDADTLLGEFAWYLRDTGGRDVRPCGLLKPNDFGLFDVYGNAVELTLDLPPDVPRSTRTWMDLESGGEVRNESAIVVRGRSYLILAPDLRSADRITSQPHLSSGPFGFRVVRTWSGGR